MPRRHLLRSVAQNEAREAFGLEERDNVARVLGVGDLQQPADAFLHEVVFIAGETLGHFEDGGEVAAVFGFIDQADGSGTAEPAIGRGGPGEEFGGEGGLILN